MKKYEGIHLYVNVENFDKVVAKEEEKTGRVNHSIHALDTFFTCIERYGKSKYSQNFVVEKITGSRLHLYLVDAQIQELFVITKDISCFAVALADYLNNDISKYKMLEKFKIQIGAALGHFYDFCISIDDEEEETSIGFAANYAAKIQCLCSVGAIAISANIYKGVDRKDLEGFYKVMNSNIQKYGEEYYYECKLEEKILREKYSKYLHEAKEYANKINLTDMVFSEPRQELNSANLSKSNGRRLYGIPFFADIREFTSQFDSDDSNLDEMRKLTTEMLLTMYKVIKRCNGVHIQFQGDRECALFHNYGDYTCYIDAVKAGLLMLDKIQEKGVCIGVGESVGTMYAAKIGARGEKDKVIVGRTVIEADRNEDDYAGNNQLVISQELYDILSEEKPVWASIFKKSGLHYITTSGYDELTVSIEKKQLSINNKNRSYNGAWGK